VNSEAYRGGHEAELSGPLLYPQGIVFLFEACLPNAVRLFPADFRPTGRRCLGPQGVPSFGYRRQTRRCPVMLSSNPVASALGPPALSEPWPWSEAGNCRRACNCRRQQPDFAAFFAFRTPRMRFRLFITIVPPGSRRSIDASGRFKLSSSCRLRSLNSLFCIRLSLSSAY